MLRTDVIRFGATYCCQHAECRAIVEMVILETRGLDFRTRGAALAYTTRRLREEGLRVATPIDRHIRRSPFQWTDGGGAVA